MNDMPMMLGVAAAALAFVSWLLWLQLGSLGVPLRRLRGLIIELWVSFALIIGLFLLADRIIGYVPRGQQPMEGILLWWARLQALPVWAQLLLIGAFILALAVLTHLLWTLGKVRRQYEALEDTTDETTEE